jgi:uncharacterized protein (UPF0261 family)
VPVVVLVGTLDTKGPELRYVRERIREAGCEVILVDAGVQGSDPDVDISADEVAAAAGEERAALATAGDRGAAVMAMARGATSIVQRLRTEGRLDGIAAVGGSGGSSIAAAAMQSLPVGVPKLLVSTMASGDTRPYVGTSDIALMYSVVDIAGLNQLSERILANAAAAIAGMTRAAVGFHSSLPPRPVVAATMYGVTTPCVEAARAWLEAHGYEVLVFHATGSGGRAMEALIRAGFISGVLDVTTSELTDEVVGGVFSAGPDRMDAAAAAGIPQVVSLGAAEMGTFGPPETVPAKYRGRLLYRHNDSITLMRISVDEAARLGRYIAAKLARASGPVTVFIPRGGLSSLSVPGAVFHDPLADAALFDALRAALDPRIEVVEVDTHLNDPAFAQAMAAHLAAQLAAAQLATRLAGTMPEQDHGLRGVPGSVLG